MGAVPPFTGVAANRMALPGQIVVCDAAMLTLGVRLGFTVTVMLLLVTILGFAQLASALRTHVNTSLFNVVVVKVAELTPALFPFTFH